MKNIHVLPTDKPSRLFKDDFGKYFISINIDQEQNHFKPQHIYITSDLDIKEGNWVLNTNTNSIAKYTGHGSMDWWVKIILTTDDQLIKDGVQAIDDEFLEWFVKNSNCEFVEVELHEISLVVPDNIYKIIMPQEEYKTSEEWQKQYSNVKVLDPDGWDRKNYQYSWFEEKITLSEYQSRLNKSTVKGLILQEEPKQEIIASEEDEKIFVDAIKNPPAANETIEKAAEKYSSISFNRQDLYDGFIEGAKSDAARDYWFKQFKKK